MQVDRVADFRKSYQGDSIIALSAPHVLTFNITHSGAPSHDTTLETTSGETHDCACRK